MPPRSLSLAIVACWLAVTGLFVYLDVWPSFHASEPTLFAIELVDEASRQADTCGWTVLKNGGAAYAANTEWKYHGASDDSFEFTCQLWCKDSYAERAGEPVVPWLPLVQFNKVEMPKSTYLVARTGRLKRLETGGVSYNLAFGGAGQEVAVKANVIASPGENSFAPHIDVSFAGLKGQAVPDSPVPGEFSRLGDPVPLSGRGLALNPLHPLRRVPDLREGQHWRLPVIDPFAFLAVLGARGEAAGATLRGAGLLPDQEAYELEARVLPGRETLSWDGKDYPCRVVKATGDGAVTSLTVWVREGDGNVLQQEAKVYGDTWTFVRRGPAFVITSRPEPPPGRRQQLAQAVATLGLPPPSSPGAALLQAGVAARVATLDAPALRRTHLLAQAAAAQALAPPAAPGPLFPQAAVAARVATLEASAPEPAP
jgi:hypothetical protein